MFITAFLFVQPADFLHIPRDFPPEEGLCQPSFSFSAVLSCKTAPTNFLPYLVSLPQMPVRCRLAGQPVRPGQSAGLLRCLAFIAGQ